MPHSCALAAHHTSMQTIALMGPVFKNDWQALSLFKPPPARHIYVCSVPPPVVDHTVFSCKKNAPLKSDRETQTAGIVIDEDEMNALCNKMATVGPQWQHSEPLVSPRSI